MTGIDTVITDWCTRLDSLEESASEAIELDTTYAIPGCEAEYEWHRVWRRTASGMAMSSNFHPGSPSPTEVLEDVERKRKVIQQYREAVEYREKLMRIGDPWVALHVVAALEQVIRTHAGADE